MKLVPDNLTYTERLIWYKNNKPLLDMEQETVSYCSNYRQLEMARASQKRAAERGVEWLGQLPSFTPTQRLLFYRRNLDLLEREKDVLSLVSNWKQFQMARDTWANEVTRKTTKSINSLEDIQETETMDSETSRKMQLWLQQTGRSFSHQEEDRQMREESRRREMRETVTKTAVDIHRMPYDWQELEGAAASYVASKVKVDELQEELNSITEAMMTAQASVTKYGLSAREMAARAYREDEESVAASRKMTRKVVVEG